MPDSVTKTSNKERALLRELAGKVAEAAADSRRMEPIRKRWRDVNALRRPDRAPVWCKPVTLWRELLPESVFVCRDPFHRYMESILRRTLYKVELDDDTPIDPFYAVDAALDVEPANLWGVEVGRHTATAKGGPGDTIRR